jgi:GNAT superfamily N-acetyltransferase
MHLEVRPTTVGDLASLYEVCLRTGDNGEDASHLHHDHTLLGSVYVGPYVVLEEGVGYTPTEDGRPMGYVLGTPDTRRFEAACERSWWPPLRARHPDPAAGATGADRELIAAIHHPARAPDDVVEQFPAHLHIDLLPSLQGHGWGRRLMGLMMDDLAAAGAPGIHLEAGSRNHRAIGFYRALGFDTLDDDGDTIRMARRL